MIRSLLLVILLILGQTFQAQSWAWMKGRDTINKKGYYSPSGVSQATNNPGARQGAVSWRDNSGNLWLFGGSGYDRIGNNGYLNDLWKYDPATNNWTWMHGDDVFLQTGIYGTMGTPNAVNKPGARDNAVSWKDAGGNFWLFGGDGFGSGSTLGRLNDLWKYTVSTGQWTWMGGSNTVNQAGTYGSIGVAAPGNIPGARGGAVAWADASGNLWLFGGIGIDGSNLTGPLNDVWKYSITSGQWTWVKGSNAVGQNGTYGSITVPAPGNQPGGRSNATGWTDQVGGLWLFGGMGLDAMSTFPGYLNDMWRYNPGTNEWVWMNGSNTGNQNGSYGTQGVASTTNTPGGRFGAMSWRDVAGNLWLFGGEGYPITGSSPGKMPDLWKYDFALGTWNWIRGGAITNIGGIYGTMGTQAGGNIVGARNSGVTWIDGNNNLWLFGGVGRGATTYTASGNLNDLWKYTNCFINPQTLTITTSNTVICKGETTTLTVTGGTNYQWNNGPLTNYNVISPTTNVTYTATSTDTNNCTFTATHTQTVDLCTSLDKLAGGTSSRQVNVYPNPNNGAFTIKTELPGATLSIMNSLGQVVYETKLQASEEQIKTPLPPALYFYSLSDGKDVVGAGKILVE